MNNRTRRARLLIAAIGFAALSQAVPAQVR